jgi:hypothetical protein
MTLKTYNGETINNVINNKATESDAVTVAAIVRTLAAGVVAFAALKCNKPSKTSMAKLAGCVRVQSDDASIILAQSVTGSPLRVTLKAMRAERVGIIRGGDTIYSPGVIDAAREIVRLIDATVTGLETIKDHASMIIPMHTVALAA